MDSIANYSEKIAHEFNIKAAQAESAIRLMDEGDTVPFIARYRKEMTGNLESQVLREVEARLRYLRNLDVRKDEVVKSLQAQGVLTPELMQALESSSTLQEVEDIYRPYKPKRRTRGTIAREKGLEPLARLIMDQDREFTGLEAEAARYVSSEKGVADADEAISGAMDIIAEDTADSPAYRKIARDSFSGRGVVKTSAKIENDTVYTMYHEYAEPVSQIAGHRILAINRGEKEGCLKVSVEAPDEEIIYRIMEKCVKNPQTETSKQVAMAVRDSYIRLIAPSIENEIRSELTERAAISAINVFARNLRSLLLQPPVRSKCILGLDPAYRTGCKLAVVDATGKMLDSAVIYPTPPSNETIESSKCIKRLINKYKVDVIAIGNGTASREAEQFTAEVLKDLGGRVAYTIVNEAGASVYSASVLGEKEFPDCDVSIRSAVSIARRLQDPLSELVKIDPESIGVGQYQHDIDRKRLSESLDKVVEDCVNSIGVDLNTASPSLLSYVSGINSTVAANIVDYRDKNGRFGSRAELIKIKKLGEKAFEQCAGFLRIPGGENALDNTRVHPESYKAAKKLLDMLGFQLESVKTGSLEDLKTRAAAEGYDRLAKETGVGELTLGDIVEELSSPGRDARDDLPKPVFRTDVMEIGDLAAGMILTGTVRNVVDFGAFVDIGVHQDGLVHKSEMPGSKTGGMNRGIAAGDIVQVRIIAIDIEKKRISLSMKGLN